MSNLGVESPPTDRASVSRGSVILCCSSVLAGLFSSLLRLLPALLPLFCTFSDSAAPGEVVSCQSLPGAHVDFEVLKEYFQAVLKALSLATSRAFSIIKLPVEHLLRDAVVLHACDMLYPSELGSAHEDVDGGQLCSFEKTF